VSGFGTDDVLSGGYAIVWRKDIKAVVSFLKTISRRECSVLIDNYFTSYY